MKTAGKMSILGGLLSAVALGSMAGVNAFKTATRPGREIYADEDFDLMTRDRKSTVRTEDGCRAGSSRSGTGRRSADGRFRARILPECAVPGISSAASSKSDGATRFAWCFYDQRGHGDSGMPRSKSCTVSQLGRDLATVVEAKVPKGPIVLVGHSMGGMTVLALAGQRPEWFEGRVIGVGLVATTAAGLAETGLTRNLQNPIIDGFRLAVRTSPGVVQHARGAARVLITPILRAASYGTDVSPRLHELSDGMLDRTSVVTIVNFLRTLELHDESASLEVLAHTPAVVICGDQDMMIPFISSKRLAADLPESELVRVHGAGHLVQLEFPAIVTDAIDKLVQRAQVEERSDVG